MSHIPYDIYKDMLERGYELGTSDCYTTIRDALERAYGIVIPNYARPENFDIPELNLFAKIQQEDCWYHLPTIDVKEMRAGDILSMKVRSPHDNVNHVGIYLGNQMFLHQLIESKPREEPLSLVWLRRIHLVSRHKDIEVVTPKFSVIDLMPNYKKVLGYVE